MPQVCGVGIAARIAASVMGLVSPQRSLVAEAPPVIPTKVAPPATSQGVPGGANFSGRLVFEPNEALRDTAGYGRAGTYEVGAWQEIALSNSYVTAGLDFICAPIADARVTVEPADKDNPEAAKHAEFLDWALTQSFRLQGHTELAARGFLLSGFSLFEPTYHQVPSALLGRPVWVPKQLAERLPNSLDPNPWLEDAEGNLRAIRQNGPRGMSGAWIRPELAAERVLLYSWKRRADNWAGESQFRSVWYIAGKIMPMLTRMIGVTLQREGAGLPVAVPLNEHTPDLTPEQRDEMMTFFANATFHESSGVVMPKGWTVEWIQSPGANKGHIIDVIEALGRWILRQLGAQQLTLGVEGTGSRSVGEVHDAKAMMHVRRVLAFIEQVLNGDSGEAHTGLVKRLIDWNFGSQTAYPRVRLLPQRPEMAPGDLATAAKTAKDGGLFTPTLKDENRFREVASFEPLTQEEFKELSGAGTTTALNGAQVTAATDLMQRVADGQLPFEAAVEALVTFYNVAPERAQKLMSTLKNFQPTPKEPPPGAPPPPEGEPDEDKKDEGDDGEPKMSASATKEPELDVWNSMWARCSNSDNKDWKRYGGRGIKVCKRWESYEAFIEDMGKRPSAAHSIDRIDNDGNYEPSNCRWATAKTQRGNRSDSVKASAQRSGWQPWRPLRASERKLKLSELDSYFTLQRERGAERIRLAVVAMLGAAAPALERAMADGKLTPEEIAAIPLDSARLDAVLNQFLAEQRKAGADFLRGELTRPPGLRAAADDDEVVTETDALIEAQKAAAKRRIINRLRGEVEKEAIDAMRTGGTAQEVVDRAIARQADTTAFKSDAGSVVTKTFNLGREEAAALLGGVTSVVYSAILDSATCDACRNMDGREAPFGSAAHDAMVPPNRDCPGGDSCRCILVFETGGEP